MFDDEILRRLKQILDQVDTIISIYMHAGDAYALAGIIGMAASHPLLSEALCETGFAIARRIEKMLGEKTGVPPGYQLSEHVDTHAQCVTLLKKHLEGQPPVEIRFTPADACSTVSLLQVAISHEHLPPTLHECSIVLGKTIQMLLSQALQSQEIYAILETGWNLDHGK
jgi:hypothetical protein